MTPYTQQKQEFTDGQGFAYGFGIHPQSPSDGQ